ncbi:polysaccharide biosynthesis tyrosine autokinase [Mariprofundus sp. EBB-1]|uniref:polysaccharide biosynthesis tyrosine autokinase n=1 Tax=Mariprofundus sp. EBB-1 TaxID=2650971 RepID=UPI000EF21F1A|nr:polysaccharide biosynthesis tyrosine autokinase [Mariprofundus sp. EBB-1]RLL50644.1 polysaccharide biosynthesis tyrosine autokinase [Mariprofundus sp. EBB-1]
MPDSQSLALNSQASSTPFDIKDEIDLAECIGIITDNYRKIIAITALFFMAATSYAFMSTPIYEVDALLQVEDKNSGLGDMVDLGAFFAGDAPVNAEIEILRSRLVLGRVVNDLSLNISASPHYFPFIGEWMARTYEQSNVPASVPLGLTSFAWGGEEIQLNELDVPPDYEGKELTLVAGQRKHYRLFDEDNTLLLEGDVGRKVEEHGISIRVGALEARPGVSFNIVKESWLYQVQQLQDFIDISEKGKKTGMLQITLENPDPSLAVSILNALANIYLDQNVGRKSEEANNALVFLKRQLPIIKEDLSDAETKMNNYRVMRGSLDVGLETKTVLDQLVEIERQISEVQLQKTEMYQRFTARHPVIQSINAKLAILNQGKKQLTDKVNKLPATEQEVLRLMRDVKVQTELYTLLLNKVQELNVTKAATIGNVRILDYAVLPDEPIKPVKALIVALGFVVGLFVSLILVFGRRLMQKGIETPEMVEQKLGLSVYATVPHSLTQLELYAQMRKHKGKRGCFLLASVNESDLAIESLRSLRTNLHFGLMDAKNNIIMMSGSAPDVGKSFVSSNLAHVLSMANKRVLLIDADLRKGHLNEYFGLDRENGLSECILGDLSLKQAVNQTSYEKLDVLTTGKIPPSPSELLMSEHFETMLAEASKFYDLVLIDTPPVLAVTDAVVIGKLVGTAFLLLRAGRHPVQEIQQAVRRFEHGGVKLQGAIFNDIKRTRSRYDYGGYQYKYKEE